MEARSRSSSASESPRRGVPGIELAADPLRDCVLLMRMRRPNLSNLGVGAAGSVDQARFVTDGRDDWGGWRRCVVDSDLVGPDLIIVVLTATMAAAASGS